MIKSKGIRILDDENNVVSVELPDILDEIENGNTLHWTILCLDVVGVLDKSINLSLLDKQIYATEKGMYINWTDLNEFSIKFHQIIDLTLIGSANLDLLHRYERDQEMYEKCDIVIEMIDSSYWIVFSKDENFINKLSKKFKDIEMLETNYKSGNYI